MTALELRFLGGIDFYLDSAPLTALKSDKGKALLCYLAVTRVKHSRSALSGLLWTDLSEKNARANLRKTISRIKPNLGHCLNITRETVSFNQDALYRLDVAEFETGLSSGSEIPRLQKCVSLYKGDFLESFDLPDAPLFEEWAQAQRARLRGIAIDTLQTLVNHFINSKEFDSGISYAKHLLTIEPWQEEAHRNLMYMLASSGQRSAAIRQFEECRKILMDELDVDPSSSTMELLDKIRQGEFEPSSVFEDFEEMGSIKLPPRSLLKESPVRNLPLLTNPLIGRQQELQELVKHLSDPDVRLVSIVGQGGVGKTLLALTVAHQLTKSKSFRNGVFFVPLSIVTDYSRLLSTITEHLGLSLAGTRKPENVIFDYVREKAALIVLDNFEQLLPKIDFLARLLQVAPLCRLLITSRERLKMREEWVLDLEGLTYPNTIQEAQKSEYGAILLFSERARQVRSRFSLDNEISGVVRICRLTEGLPLALEQAASLMRVSHANEIADHIEDRLDTLSTTLRNLPERHRSMRAVLDGSWQWLSEDEQKVSCRLSVFQGGFTCEAAEQVADANLNTLSSLVDKSLVRVETGYGETTRYNLHELVRQYSTEKLLESGQAQFKQLHMAHLDFFISLAERAKQFWDTEMEWEWLERLEPERGNLHSALRWAIEQKKAEFALRLNAALHTFWLFNSTADEALDWLESSLSVEWNENSRTMMRIRAQVLVFAGYAGILISDLKLAEFRFQEGAELYSKLEDQRGIAWSLRGSGLVCLIRGDLVGAQNFMQDSWDICQETRNEYSLAWAAYALGIVAIARAELEEAESLLETAITHFRQHGRELGTFHTLISLGQLERAQGKMSKAMACYKEALYIQNKARYIHYVAQILEGLAHIAVADNNMETAVQLFGQAQARRDKFEMDRWAHHEIEYQQSLALTRDQMPTSIWQAAWDKGYEMNSQQGLDFAKMIIKAK